MLKLFRWSGMAVAWGLVGFYLFAGHPFPNTWGSFNSMASELAPAWLLITLGITIYFAPTAIARSRKHNNLRSIAVVNVFLGWTIVGWVAALSWAVSKDAKQSSTPAAATQPLPDPREPHVPAKRFCASCGAGTAPGERFCGACGHSNEIAEAAS